MNEKEKTLEEKIVDMGYGFRNLVRHTEGGNPGIWSCQLGFEIHGGREFWGDTPMEAVDAARDWLNSFDE